MFQVQQLSGMKLKKRLARYFEKQMSLKPRNFLGSIPEAAVLRAVTFIQASVPLQDNVITRSVCTSTVCFGWIIVHGAIGIQQHSNTAVGLHISAGSLCHTNFGVIEKATKKCENQHPDMWAMAHEKQVSSERTNALDVPHCQNEPLTS